METVYLQQMYMSFHKTVTQYTVLFIEGLLILNSEIIKYIYIFRSICIIKGIKFHFIIQFIINIIVDKRKVEEMYKPANSK